jgi:exodeoxyribonuclease-3
MRIASFNINNINKRLENLLAWLAKTKPDVACLQELKAGQAAFPAEALRDVGYEAVWSGERSWNGVAILARDRVPVVVRSSLLGDPKDFQARYIEAAVNGILITSLYLPNGNPQPGPKFDYKLAWFERLIAHTAELLTEGVPVVLTGDYNVVRTAQDIPTRSLDNNALIQPASRQAFARLLAQGWTDALRKLQPEGPLWTFWDYKRGRWPLDKGMRLALTAGCVVKKTRAIMLRYGSCSICDLSVTIRLLRDQCELAQVVIIERTLSVGGLIQSECSGDFDFERTGVDEAVDLVQGWRVIFAVVALELNALTFLGNGLDAVRIGDASTRSQSG